MQFSLTFGRFENLPSKSSIIIHREHIQDPLIRNLPKISLRGFLYHGEIFRKNQPEVSKKVVSILPVLTVLRPGTTSGGTRVTGEGGPTPRFLPSYTANKNVT